MLGTAELMYCSLQERFQGALVGCAIAEQTVSSPPVLTQRLIQQGQAMGQIKAAARFSPKPALDGLAQTVLVSLMLHDSPTERRKAIVNYSFGLQWLSEAIAARLQRQQPSFSEPPESAYLMDSIQAVIHRQLPLPVAVQHLYSLPDNRQPLDQVMILALYCWLCMPQQFTVNVGRSHQILQIRPHSSPDLVFLPALTGLLTGASLGSNGLPHSDVPMITRSRATANHLFQIWAGIGTAIRANTVATPVKTVIAQPGQLKPRNSDHLKLNSDYD